MRRSLVVWTAQQQSVTTCGTRTRGRCGDKGPCFNSSINRSIRSKTTSSSPAASSWWTSGCKRPLDDRQLRPFVSTISSTTCSSSEDRNILASSVSSSTRFQASKFSSLQVAEELMESDSDANNNAEHSVELFLQQERSLGQEEANILGGDVPPKDRHCQTCTCKQHASSSMGPSSAPRTHLETAHDPTVPLPPPLPLPLYSVRRRLLSKLYTTALQSTPGQQRLVDALLQNTAQAYIALTQHFMNQSEPAYCGITTACMVLNALECDTVWRWKGGWRYFANEDVLLAHCRGCWSRERLQRSGITVHEFQRLVACHGLHVTLQRPYPITSVPVLSDDSPHHNNSNSNNNNEEETYHTLDEFRADVQTILSGGGAAADAVTQRHRGILVVSFSRAGLGQTGEGHFSPVAAYHANTDSVLILDVARYKYPPYWVSVAQLYHAMQPCDPATNQPRGWLLVHDHHHPIDHKHKSAGGQNNDDGHEGDDDDCDEDSDGPTQAGLGENRRPAHLVPVAGRDPHPCPMHPVQVRYCPNREKPIP